MPKKLINIKAFPQLPRIAQESNYYCGPATVQMLCGFLGVNVEQEQIVEAVTTKKKVQMQGITVEELGAAIYRLQLGLSFWLKKGGSITELAEIVNKYHHPVGVEWQGLFDYPEEEASYGDEDDDPGHVSIVTHIDTRRNEILIADPFAYYVKKDRYFSVLEFERRWWDVNTIINPKTKKRIDIENYHAMFILTWNGETWPEKLGMGEVRG